MDNVNVKIFKVEGDPLPFVEIKFKGMDGKAHTALMLMDSGSNINHLAMEMRVLIGDNDWLPEESDEVMTVTNKAAKVPCGQFLFEMDGKPFKEKFYFFKNHHLMKIDDMVFVGVLGNHFMQEYHLAIDYANMTVHTSSTTLEELKIKKCDFITSIEYSLKYYNVPTLHLQGIKHDAIVIADTGCDNISISQNAIEKCGLIHKLTGNVQFADGPDGSVEVRECLLDFNIAEQLDADINMFLYKETAEIMPHSLNVTDDGDCDDNGNLLVPLEGMIGSPFMARQEWVLDFGAKAIYRRKNGS